MFTGWMGIYLERGKLVSEKSGLPYMVKKWHWYWSQSVRFVVIVYG